MTFHVNVGRGVVLHDRIWVNGRPVKGVHIDAVKVLPSFFTARGDGVD